MLLLVICSSNRDSIHFPDLHV